MHKLNVIYCGWGEHWPLGTLADTGQQIVFEYTQQAIERGLKANPLFTACRVLLPMHCQTGGACC